MTSRAERLESIEDRYVRARVARELSIALRKVRDRLGEPLYGKVLTIFRTFCEERGIPLREPGRE